MSRCPGVPAASSPSLDAPRGENRRFSSFRSAIGLLALLAGTHGCFDTDQGPAPPTQGLYYPTSLVVSPGGGVLYVANSDFDLQYRAGTVQAIDLARLRALLPLQDEFGRVDCASRGLTRLSPANALLYPGACGAISLASPSDGQGSLIRNSVDIGAFATSMILVRRPPDPAKPGETVSETRLMVPVRGDPSITWIDVDDDLATPTAFRLDCDQGSGRRCSDSHRAGIDPASNLRSLTMPSEPYEVAASDRTDAMVVSHQTSGAVSLLLNGWRQPNASVSPCPKFAERPTLAFVLGGLPTGVTGVAALPMPRAARDFPLQNGQGIAYQPGFLVGYRDTAQIDVVRYYDDCEASPDRPFLALTGRSGINVNAGGYDSRGIAIDPTDREACEDACPARVAHAGELTSDEQAQNDQARQCLIQCAATPVRVYLANRTPPSLLVGRAVASVSQYGTDDYLSFEKTIPLSQGASQVRIGHIVDLQGQLRPRAFILSFDARQLHVYDPETARIESITTTGRGPSSIAFDPVAPGLAYLAHFTDSYLAVLDLDMRHSASYLTLIASVGTPTPPREQ